MDMYPPAAVAGVCIGGLVLAAVAAALVVLCRQRRRQYCDHSKAPHDEVTTSRASTEVTAATEAQPLLDDSAIRTRYADSANEYARSLLDPSSSIGYATPRSQPWALSRSPYNPVQNIVNVAMADSSDSEDSGMGYSSDEPEPSPLPGSTPTSGYSLDGARAEPAASYEPAAQPLSAPHVQSAGRSPAADSALGADCSAARERPASPAANRSEQDSPAPMSRPRCSTLNAQAKEFVPAASSRTAASSDADRKKPEIKRRCRFWPACSNRNCKYVHPRQECQAHPNCSFGNNCIYVHPSDVPKIGAVIASRHSRRSKRKIDIVKLNNLERYLPPLHTPDDPALH